MIKNLSFPGRCGFLGGLISIFLAEVNSRVRLDVELAIAGRAEKVEVQAQAQILASESSELGLGYPAITVTGLSTVGDATAPPLSQHSNTWQIIDGIEMVRGSHGIKIGGEIRDTRLNAILDYYTRGSLSFLGAISGSGISDLLLGFPTFGLQSQSDNPQALRTTAYSAYVQDDWKIARRLTLNLGLRYEYNTPPVDH